MRQTTWLAIWLWFLAVVSYFRSEERHASVCALLAVATTIYCLIRNDAPDTPKKRDGNADIEDVADFGDFGASSDSSS